MNGNVLEEECEKKSPVILFGMKYRYPDNMTIISNRRVLEMLKGNSPPFVTSLCVDILMSTQKDKMR